MQTVQLLVLDGLGMLPPESLRIPLQEKLKRIGGMQLMERMNCLHRSVIIKIDKVGHRLVHEHHGMAWVDGVTVEPHYKVHNYQRPSTYRAMQELFASRWVAKRCWTLGFVCPSEARWWMVSKIARFFWKKGKGK